MKILVVEDDKDINQLIQKILNKEGYQVTAAYSGTEAMLRLDAEQYDLLISDLMLPGLSGEELIQSIRQQKHNLMQILVLSAKVEMEDRINVLGLGADDYMTKPFEPRELVARVQAQLRRGSMMKQQLSTTTKNQTEPDQSDMDQTMEKELVYLDLKLNPVSNRVTVGGNPIRLTVHEFNILAILMAHPHKVYSKEALYQEVWKNGYYGEDNTISVHISNIRKKIATVTDQEYISTVWGIGFKMKEIV